MASTDTYSSEYPVTASSRTKAMIRHTTPSMAIFAVRGGGREGHVPTLRHNPPLLQRRYSVDVNTEGWAKAQAPEWNNEGNPAFQGPEARSRSAEIDPPLYGMYKTYSAPVPCHIRALFLPSYPPRDDQIFHRLPNSSITNQEWYLIKETAELSWWNDSILNVALEMLSEKYHCQERGVEICNAMISTILYIVGAFGDTDEDDFAHYQEEKNRFYGKRYIFLPINDGIGSLEQGEGEMGCHWSFVVINRRARTAHYIDSLFVHNKEWQDLASNIVTGVGYLLGEQYEFKVEWNTPNQNAHNHFGQDSGACGPFVCYMIEIYLSQLVIPTEEIGDGVISFHILPNLGSRPEWSFNSYKYRVHIMKKIMGLRAKEEQLQAAVEHDLAALENINPWVELLDYPLDLDRPAPRLIQQHPMVVNAAPDPKEDQDPSDSSTEMSSCGSTVSIQLDLQDDHDQPGEPEEDDVEME